MYKIMSLKIFNQSFELIGIIDKYYSLIWTDRFYKSGEFELQLFFDESYLEILKEDYFCSVDESEHWCVIEKLDISKEEDQAPILKVSGRSIECILQRRIVLDVCQFENIDNESETFNVEQSMKQVLEEQFMLPQDINRRVDRFIFKESDDPKINERVFKEVYDKDDVLTVIEDICKQKFFGYKITIEPGDAYDPPSGAEAYQEYRELEEENRAKKHYEECMVFQFYNGANRSLEKSEEISKNRILSDQWDNNAVIFSPYYQNLLNSSYFFATKNFRNLMYMIRRSNPNKYLEVPLDPYGFPSGLERRECCADEEDVRSNKTGRLTNAQLSMKARKYMVREKKVEEAFEGEVVPGIMYNYMEDYFLGDIVQFQDFYGNNRALRIIEVIISCDKDGFKVVPGFEDPEDYEYDEWDKAEQEED